MAFQIYVNGEKVGPHHLSLAYTQDLCEEFAIDENNEVYAIDTETGNKLYWYPIVHERPKQRKQKEN